MVQQICQSLILALSARQAQLSVEVAHQQIVQQIPAEET
jgi:hypothetical protein